jgi:hypothetical protein
MKTIVDCIANYIPAKTYVRSSAIPSQLKPVKKEEK